MFRNIIIIILCTVSCQSRQDTVLIYPNTPSKPMIDTYHDVDVKDEYRNLENLKDSTIIDWFKSQGNFSDSLLGTISNKDFFYKKIIELEKNQNENIDWFKVKKDRSYFYIKRKTEDDIGKLYYRKSKEATEQLLFNPSDYKKDYIINYFKVNWDLTKVAISLSLPGEDESEVIIYDIKAKTLLPDVVKNISPSLIGNISWLPDNSSFFYLHIPHFDYADKSYLLNTKGVIYKIGQSTEKIQDVFSKTHNPEINFTQADFPILEVFEKSPNYIFAKISGSSDFKDVYYSSLDSTTDLTNIKWKLLFSKKEKINQYIISNDSLIYRTAKDASNYKICKVPLFNLNYETPISLVKEKKDAVIVDFEYLRGKLYYTTIKNGVDSNFFVLNNKNEETKIKLPSPSGSSYLGSRGDDLIISIHGWTKPFIWYRYNPEENIFFDLILNPRDYPEFKDFVVEEIEVPSHDGVLVPLSIIYNKGLVKNGKNRTIILGYGAYGGSMSPFFDVSFLSWVSEGGIWAIPHIRGGGEKGDAWHKAGYKTTKPNTWKDVIACTEYLINQNYTSPNHTINYGVSAGGIAMGRAITERPDLFKVSLLSVPALNILRSEFQPNGENSVKEFGTLKDSLEFRALYEMDAYHHIKDNVNYPAILVSTGMNDGIVTPWDPAKFVAKAQNTLSKSPIILKVDFNSGHGGDTMTKFYNETSEFFAFALWQTGHPEFQPK